MRLFDDFSLSSTNLERYIELLYIGRSSDSKGFQSQYEDIQAREIEGYIKSFYGVKVDILDIKINSPLEALIPELMDKINQTKHTNPDKPIK